MIIRSEVLAQGKTVTYFSYGLKLMKRICSTIHTIKETSAARQIDDFKSAYWFYLSACSPYYAMETTILSDLMKCHVTILHTADVSADIL